MIRAAGMATSRFRSREDSRSVSPAAPGSARSLRPTTVRAVGARQLPPPVVLGDPEVENHELRQRTKQLKQEDNLPRRAAAYFVRFDTPSRVMGAPSTVRSVGRASLPVAALSRPLWRGDRGPGAARRVPTLIGETPRGRRRASPTVSGTYCDRLTKVPSPQHHCDHLEYRPGQAVVLPSNRRDTYLVADELQRPDQRIKDGHGPRPARCMRWDPRCGVVRGMSSFHESFNEDASDVVHSANAQRYTQVERGAPGRIRTYATASGDR